MNINNCNNSSPLERLPWGKIMEVINDEYQNIVEKTYGPHGNKKNEEMYELLQDTKFNAYVYNKPPFGDTQADLGFKNGFIGNTAKTLTGDLRDFLSKEYSVPDELLENLALASIHSIALYSQSNNACTTLYGHLCNSGYSKWCDACCYDW